MPHQGIQVLRSVETYFALYTTDIHFDIFVPYFVIQFFFKIVYGMLFRCVCLQFKRINVRFGAYKAFIFITGMYERVDERMFKYDYGAFFPCFFYRLPFSPVFVIIPFLYSFNVQCDRSLYLIIPIEFFKR